MQNVHLTPELLDSVVRLELPGEVLARLMWDHLPEVCSECGDAMAAWRNRSKVRLQDYDAAFEKVIASARENERRADPRLRRAKRELAELLRTEGEVRLRKVERATKRFASPLLAHLLIEEAFARRYDDPAETLELARVAHAVAQRTEAGNLLVRAAAHLGNAYRINARLGDAHQAFTRARRDLRRYNVVDPLLYAEIDSLEGSLRRDRGDSEEALKLLSRSILVYRMKGADLLAALVLHQLGSLHHRLGDFEESLEAFHQELELLGEDADPETVASVHQNLVVLYADAGQPAKARTLLEAHRSSIESLPGKTFALRTIWVEGRIARGLEEFQAAEAHFQDAVRGFVHLEDGYDAALVCLDLAETYLARSRGASLARLSSQIVPVLLTHDLHQEAVAALGLFQNAIEQGLLTRFLLEQIRGRVDESRTSLGAPN